MSSSCRQFLYLGFHSSSSDLLMMITYFKWMPNFSVEVLSVQFHHNVAAISLDLDLVARVVRACWTIHCVAPIPSEEDAVRPLPILIDLIECLCRISVESFQVNIKIIKKNK
jgi:hypothetical protein